MRGASNKYVVDIVTWMVTLLCWATSLVGLGLAWRLTVMLLKFGYHLLP